MNKPREWSRRVGRNKHVKSIVAALAGLSVGVFTTTASAEFDVIFNFDTPTVISGVGDPGVVPLHGLGKPGLETFLGDLIAAGKPASLKVHMSSLPADMSIFDSVVVENIFLDFEGATAVATKDAFLAALAGTASAGANIGNFKFDRAFPDSTIPAPFMDIPVSALTGLTMSNAQVYPGDPDVRNPASGNSPAPSILSAMFTLPIQRVNNVSTEIEIGGFTTESNVPYITRFNNFGNSDLDTDPSGVSEEFAYDGEILSRGDFSAQTAHYNARGADSLILFQPGVVGYTKAEMQTDALAGWTFWDGVTGGDGVTLSDKTTIVGEGTTSNERAGALWSGVANSDVLQILVSNLSGAAKTVELPFAINGFILSDREFALGHGEHLKIMFGADGFMWDLSSTTLVFTDDDRSGIGIPEPASLALLLMGAGLVGFRRRSKK